MTARHPRPETVAVQSKVSRDPKTACAMSMLDKSVDASPFQCLKGWLLPNDSPYCKRWRLIAAGKAIGRWRCRQNTGALSSMFIFNLLIQISSSNKGHDFLCTALFFPCQSSTWRLFNLVFSALPGTPPNMNNFDLPASSVDKSWFVQKLSPWLFRCFHATFWRISCLHLVRFSE